MIGMIGMAPLVADLEDLIGIAIFILFIVIGAIGHLATKIKEAQEAARRRQRRAQGQAQAQGRPKQAALEDEIGQFLRGAAQRREQGGPQAGRPAARPGRPGPAGPIVRPGPQARPSRPSASAQPSRPAPQARPPRPAQRPAAPPADVILADEVEQHGGLRPLDQEQRRTFETHIDAEVQGMERHVHEIFDHQLGRLDHAGDRGVADEGVVAVLPQTAAAGLGAMLADADSLRQAILIHEILTRPEDRWTL